MRSMRRCGGFTLIELMITVAILAILAAVSLPSYSAYVQRSRVPVGLDALSAYATRMEQRYQDTGCYASTCAPSVGTACAVSLPTPANFTVTCALGGSTGQAYTVTATGSGPVAGYTYSIDQQGTRATTAHPKGIPSTSCWSVRGSVCDA
jgi:type IV pilus assembly protein PilE